MLALGAVLLPGLRAAERNLPLTAEERAWIAAHPVVRVGHMDGAGPYSVRDGSGRLGGLNVDYLNLIAERTGLRFEHTASAVWTEIFEGAAAGRLDIVAGVGRTDERERVLSFGRPYAFSPDVIVTRADSPILFDPRDLNGLQVGLARSSPSIHPRAPNAVIVHFDNMRDAVVAVAQGEVYAALTDALVTAYVVKSEGLTNLRLGVVYDDRANVHFGVRRELAMLQGILDKAVADITPAEHQAIRARWLTIDYEQDRWWLSAFKASAGVAITVIIGAALLIMYQRRLARELAQRRRVQAELEQTRDRLTRTSEEKSALMHTLVHDLRNPLTSVVLGTDLLALGRLPPEQAETVARLRAQVRQMTRLIDDLMDVNAIEEGRRRYQAVRFDLSRTVRAAVEAFAEAAGAKRLRFELDLPEDELPVDSDEGALRQVFDNLISNAVKYSPAGGSVRLGLRAEGGFARVEVADAGPGIARGELEHLFTKYGRGSAQPTAGEKSSGLGLWIVKRLSDALGADVRCETEPGRGSTFIVTLPLARERSA